MNYAEIKNCDIANGVGARTTLFVSGCTRHCPGCFNECAWDFSYGKPFDEKVQDEVVRSLDPVYIAGLSVLGGEPMEPSNQRGLVDFLERVRREHPGKTIWLYTGDGYDDLLEGGAHHTEVTDRILRCLDVLVDGDWREDEHDVSLRFKGSANQRLIDMPKTLAKGEVVLWKDDPVFSTHAM